MGIADILMLLSLLAMSIRGQEPIEDPRDVALRASNMAIYAMGFPQYIFFGTWSYEGAGIVRGLWEIQQVYDDFPIESFLHGHLNYFQTEPSEYGYQILQNYTLDLNETTVGDGIGLFPIGYADRLRYAKDTDAYNAADDFYIITETVEKHVYGFSYHLEDGTISRPRYIEGSPYDERGRYLWVDDMFMGTALTSALSLLTGDPSHVSESARQSILFTSHMVIEAEMDGLFHHGFNNFTGEPSCCKWGRGNGWSIMAKIDALEAMEDLGLQDEGLYSELLSIFVNHCEALKNVQSAEGGWSNILTNSDTFIETSATAMYLLAYIKGVERGWLDNTEYQESIENAWRVVSAAVQIDGTVVGIIRGTGVLATEEEYERPTDYEMAGPGLGGVLRSIAAAGRYFQLDH